MAIIKFNFDKILDYLQDGLERRAKKKSGKIKTCSATFYI